MMSGSQKVSCQELEDSGVWRIVQDGGVRKRSFKSFEFFFPND